MKFQIKEVNGRPLAEFPDETSPRDWLLSFFLDDTRPDVEDFLSEIRKARRGEPNAGLTCNHVDVEFYPDRAVIEDLYPEDENAEPARAELTLDDAEKLLLDWQAALEQWRAQQAA